MSLLDEHSYTVVLSWNVRIDDVVVISELIEVELKIGPSPLSLAQEDEIRTLSLKESLQPSMNCLAVTVDIPGNVSLHLIREVPDAI